MPATSFPEYARSIADILDRVVATGEAVLLTLQVDQRSSMLGFISGSLQFDDRSALHFREFVNMGRVEPKLMYAYHYQDADSHLIFRYDNAAHRPALSFSEHKHSPSTVVDSAAPTLAEVLDQIVNQRDP